MHDLFVRWTALGDTLFKLGLFFSIDEATPCVIWVTFFLAGPANAEEPAQRLLRPTRPARPKHRTLPAQNETSLDGRRGRARRAATTMRP